MEKRIRFQQKASEANLKAQTNLIIAVMKKAPSSVPHLKKMLTDLKYINPATDEVAVTEAAGAHSIAASGSGAQSGSRSSPPLGVGSEPLFDESAPVPDDMTTFGTASAELLSHILNRLEPVVFNSFSFRAFMKRGMKRIPKPPLLEVLEFVTDCSPDTPIDSFENVGALIQWLSDRNIDLGRRAREMSLPMRWATDGVYSTQIREGVVFLVDKFMNLQCEVRSLDIQSPIAVEDSAFTIANNFSSNRATLTKVGARMPPILCKTVFHSPPNMMGGAKRPLAIADGSEDFTTPEPKRSRSPSGHAHGAPRQSMPALIAPPPSMISTPEASAAQSSMEAPPSASAGGSGDSVPTGGSHGGIAGPPALQSTVRLGALRLAATLGAQPQLPGSVFEQHGRRPCSGCGRREHPRRRGRWRVRVGGRGAGGRTSGGGSLAGADDTLSAELDYELPDDQVT